MAEAVQVDRAFLAPLPGSRTSTGEQYTAHEAPDEDIGGPWSDQGGQQQQHHFAWPHHNFELHSRWGLGLSNRE